MKEKCFFKSKDLQRKAIAGGLSAVFSTGVFSSYAGATMPIEQMPVVINVDQGEEQELRNLVSELNLNNIKVGENFTTRVLKVKNIEHNFSCGPFKGQTFHFKDFLKHFNEKCRYIDARFDIDILLKQVYGLTDEQISELKGRLGDSFPKKEEFFFLFIVHREHEPSRKEIEDDSTFLINPGLYTTGKCKEVMLSYYKDVVEEIKKIKEEDGSEGKVGGGKGSNVENKISNDDQIKTKNSNTEDNIIENNIISNENKIDNPSVNENSNKDINLNNIGGNSNTEGNNNGDNINNPNNDLENSIKDINIEGNVIFQNNVEGKIPDKNEKIITKEIKVEINTEDNTIENNINNPKNDLENLNKNMDLNNIGGNIISGDIKNENSNGNKTLNNMENNSSTGSGNTEDNIIESNIDNPNNDLNLNNKQIEIEKAEAKSNTKYNIIPYENKEVENLIDKKLQKRNNKKKIFTGLVITAVFLTILAVGIIAAVKLRGKTGADNQSGNNSTNPIEKTGNKKQQGTEQTGSDDTQVVSNKTSSVFPTALGHGAVTVGGAIGGLAAPAIFTAVSSSKKSNDDRQYVFTDLDGVRTDDFVIKGNTTTNQIRAKKVVGKPFSAKKLDAAKDKKTEVVK